jgi:hypothetical protein
VIRDLRQMQQQHRSEPVSIPTPQTPLRPHVTVG